MLAASVVDGAPTLSDDFTNELPSAGYSFVAIDPTGSVRRTVARRIASGRRHGKSRRCSWNYWQKGFCCCS